MARPRSPSWGVTGGTDSALIQGGLQDPVIPDGQMARVLGLTRGRPQRPTVAGVACGRFFQ